MYYLKEKFHTFLSLLKL